MAGAQLGKAYIEVRAGLDAFPAELREKLKLAMAEATEGVHFEEAEVNMRKAGEGLAEELGDSVEKEAEPRMRKAGKKSGESFFSGLKGIWPIARASFLPLLIALAVEIGAYLTPAVTALAAAIPAAAAVAVGAIAPVIAAFHGVGSAVAGALSGNATKEQLAAMQGLTPAAKAFVLQLYGVRDQLKGMQRDAQEAFFTALNPGLREALKLLPMVRTYFGQFAGDMGNFAHGVLSALGGNSGTLESILIGIHNVLSDLAPLGVSLTRMFLTLSAVALPFLDSLTRGFVVAVEHLDAFITEAADSGALANFFQGALVILRALGDALVQVGGLVGALLSGLSGSGGQALGFLTEILRDLNAFFSSAQGKQVLASVFGLLNQALISLHDILVPLLPLLGELISDFAGGLTDALKAITPLLVATANFLAAHPDLVKAAIAAWAAYRTALIMVAIAEAIVDALDPATWIVLLVAAIIAAVAVIVIYWDKIKSAALTAWHAIVDAGKAAWKWLQDAAGQVGDWFNSVIKFFEDLPDKIIGFVMGLPGRVESIFSDLAQKALYWAGYLVGYAIGLFLTLPVRIWDAISQLPSLIGHLWTDVFDWSKNELEKLGSWLNDFFTSLPGKIWNFLTALPGVLRDAFRTAWHVAKDTIVTWGEDALSWIEKLPGRIVGFFSGVGTAIVHGLRDALNSVIRGINKGIDDAAGPLHSVLPHIPYLARGGIVSSPTLAMIGESAPEVVIPLSRPGRAQQLADQSGLTQLLVQGMQEANLQLTVLAMLDTGDFIKVIDTRVRRGLDVEAAALATSSKSGGF